jgi:hypothetical protein
LLAHRVSQARKVHLYGEPAEHTFREAGLKFLAENQHKRTIECDVRTLKVGWPPRGLRGACCRWRYLAASHIADMRVAE